MRHALRRIDVFPATEWCVLLERLAVPGERDRRIRTDLATDDGRREQLTRLPNPHHGCDLRRHRQGRACVLMGRRWSGGRLPRVERTGYAMWHVLHRVRLSIKLRVERPHLYG